MPSDEAHGVRAALLIEHFRLFLCDARREGARIGIIEQSAPFSDRYITSSSPTLLRCRPRGAETSSPSPWSLGAANAKNASLTMCYARRRGAPAGVDHHPPPDRSAARRCPCTALPRGRQRCTPCVGHLLPNDSVSYFVVLLVVGTSAYS